MISVVFFFLILSPRASKDSAKNLSFVLSKEDLR